MKGTPTSFVCHQCGKEGIKTLGAVNAAKKKGQNLYCTRDCSVLGRRTRTPEQLKAYQDAYRSANRERLRQHAREYRFGRGREQVVASQRASYQRNREACLERSAEYQRQHRKQIQERIKRWLKANPDKADAHSVKANLSASLGVRVAELPADLVGSKVAEVRLKRLLRELAQNDKKES